MNSNVQYIFVMANYVSNWYSVKIPVEMATIDNIYHSLDGQPLQLF